MSIIVTGTDARKSGSTRVYPLADFRDYPGETDHRQEIVQASAQYPENGQPQLREEQKRLAK